MLNSLYIEATRRKDSINEILPVLKKKSIIKEKWSDLKINSSKEDFSIGAGDGSFNKKNFLSFTFYAVDCESLIFNGDLKKIERFNIDSTPNHSFLDDLLRTYMGTFEIKCALESIREYNVDYYLYDGSLFGDLIRPFPKGADIPYEKKEEIIKICEKELIENINNFNKELSTSKLINKYYKIYKDKFEYKIFLSNIEKLYSLAELLKHRKNIIAISKSSNNNEIFSTNISDIAIFDKYTNNPGLSQIIYKNISNEVKHQFPTKDDFFKSLEFTIFYLRLERGKNVLKVELPYKASKDEIIKIVEKINKYSIEGYPYLLKKAHNDVKITNRNIGELINIVNIQERSGREMLK